MGTGELDRDEAVLGELGDGEVDGALQVGVAGNSLGVGEGIAGLSLSLTLFVCFLSGTVDRSFSELCF